MNTNNYCKECGTKLEWEEQTRLGGAKTEYVQVCPKCKKTS